MADGNVVAVQVTVPSESDSASDSAVDREAGTARLTLASIGCTAASLSAATNVLEGHEVDRMSPKQSAEGSACLVKVLTMEENEIP